MKRYGIIVLVAFSTLYPTAESEFIKKPKKEKEFKTRSEKEEFIVQHSAEIVKIEIPRLTHASMHLQTEVAEIIDAWACSDDTYGIKKADLQTLETIKQTVNEIKAELDSAAYKIDVLTKKLKTEAIKPHKRARTSS